MPPSPAMRVTPRKEVRVENHKRGHSLESGLLYREKEDDLALFNEVQNTERDNFLLQSNDNFEDTFSTKLRYFSDNKLGVSVPSRGEGSDLLYADGDKNDYDWLITPPETPLFSSLDDVAPTINLATRGRPRSQPVSISRSSTMEKGDRSSRGSASPHRLSPSRWSGNSTLQSRSGPYSATHSSPPPTMRSPSPSRKLSPQSSKQSQSQSQSPAVRSRTPTPRRMSTDSAGTSPKIRASQFNIPGFSSEAPPNLRTSLADRPASYVRGSSPVSRNGRKSMSPTSTRSVSSSRSHDQDPFRSSVALSGSDDVDSLQSISVSRSDRSAPRRPLSFSRRPTKVLSSSAPKRSDLVQQMDRKAPQNMFRPLLSGVPSSTFCVGNTNVPRHSLVSKNSPITTSRSASFDLATSGDQDAEESRDSVEIYYQNVHDESLNEVAVNRIIDGSSNVAEKSSQVESTITMGDSCAECSPDMILCYRCGCIFHSAEILTERDEQLCQECGSLKVNSTATNSLPDSSTHILEHRSLEVLEQSPITVEKIQHQDLSIGANEERERTFATQQVIKQLMNGSEGSGISLLLKRSGSGKGHVVQSRSFTASNTSFTDFSYTRDSLNSMRSSIEHSSASLSSSFDLGSSRQTEIRIHRQSSGHKSDIENYRYDMPVKHKRSTSSLSCGSSHMFQVLSCHGDSSEVSVAHMDKEFGEDTSASYPHEQSLASECIETAINAETLSFIQEDDATPPISCADRVNVAEVPYPSSINSVSETEKDNADVIPANSQSIVRLTNAKNCENVLQQNDVITANVEASHPVQEESSILLNNVSKKNARSLTLDEATDAILFCSSMVHNLAYEAANIAIDKESLQMEPLQPTLTSVGKSNIERRDVHLRTTRKRSSKSQKARQNHLDVQTQIPLSSDAFKADEKSSPQSISGAPKNSDSMKPPKLESKCNCIIM